MIKYAKLKPSSTTPDFKDDDVTSFWFDSLKNVPIDKLSSAMNKLVQGIHFPCIDEILKSSGVVEFDEDEIAREFVPKIVNYVERFGYTNPDLARKEMGDAHWSIISAIGGWDYVCNLEYKDFTFLQPQWRETAKVCIKKLKAGMADGLIGIETNSQQLKLKGILDGLQTKSLR
jgi:hypothetical protein